MKQRIGGHLPAQSLLVGLILLQRFPSCGGSVWSVWSVEGNLSAWCLSLQESPLQSICISLLLSQNQSTKKEAILTTGPLGDQTGGMSDTMK